jgi:hypothetical protein
MSNIKDINLNELAVEITKKESGIKEIDIAQTKEILKHTLIILAEYYHTNNDAFDKLMERYYIHKGKIE